MMVHVMCHGVVVAAALRLPVRQDHRRVGSFSEYCPWSIAVVLLFVAVVCFLCFVLTC